MTWVDAADAEAPDESVLVVDVRGTLLALAKVDGAWHAVETWCTHAECPLSDGWIEGGAIRCPCHGSLFDLATGAVLEGPAEEPVRVLATRVVDGRVEIELA
jgi:3-phenylpropionate/trans-cinnamate dioxygenase ferredoxin component